MPAPPPPPPAHAPCQATNALAASPHSTSGSVAPAGGAPGGAVMLWNAPSGGHASASTCSRGSAATSSHACSGALPA
eukprot:64827-Chlamydomonas_euryale.AAC.1